MLSFKNLTPQQLSASTAIVIALPISTGIYFYTLTWWIGLLSLSVIFLGSYGIIYFMLQQFINRKIKLIYKLIYQTKASKREEFYYKNILPQKSIEEVREDVQEWAEQERVFAKSVA
jgi:two-component system, OmpR family, phosphate regulon sensor histidine kinase PhoR